MASAAEVGILWFESGGSGPRWPAHISAQGMANSLAWRSLLGWPRPDQSLIIQRVSGPPPGCCPPGSLAVVIYLGQFAWVNNQPLARCPLRPAVAYRGS